MKASCDLNEKWKDVIGYEDIYQVSNLGRVRRVAMTMGTHGRIIKKQQAERYMRVYLSWRDNRENALVHRLVAMAFVPNPQNKPQVNHIDGNKHNNCYINLEWVTSSENHRHASRVLKRGCGSKQWKSKLRESDIPRIILQRKKGLTHRKIANNFGVNRSTIGGIVNGKHWIYSRPDGCPLTA